jgi:hypothetical protein
MPELPRCEVVPLAQHQAVFQVDGREVTRWNFGADYPGPYFYPLLGPESRQSVTRMGHPGAPNHDHHRSVWFAHNKVLGIDFWGYAATAFVRQRMWYVYEDGPEHARMAVLLDWLDGHDPQPLMEQDLIATLRPLPEGEYTLDLQTTFRPRAASLELQQTNFGFLAVRVAKSISAHFGGGRLTSSSGLTGEPAIFGTAAEWMDYSGPMQGAATAVSGEGDGGPRRVVTEGITLFDHPSNPTYPAKWHVRDDGWMGPSVCRDAGITITKDAPLTLRYLLHVHRGETNPMRAAEVTASWKGAPRLQIGKSMTPHHQYAVIEERTE